MKQHYVYKLTNVRNGKIYIGARSHPDPRNDEYLSSSRIITNIIQNEGPGVFDKEILHLYPTREEAANKESEYLTEEFCESTTTYNINFWDPGVQSRGFRIDLWDDYYDEIRKLYVGGMSTLKLAAKFNCDRATIGKIVSDIMRSKSEAQQNRFKTMNSGNRDTDFDKRHLQECIRLYEEEKWSVRRIASHFNRSTSLITRRLLDNGIKIRDRKYNNEMSPPKGRPDIWKESDKIVLLYSQGYNKNEIAEQYECSWSLITHILDDNNVEKLTAFDRFRIRNIDTIERMTTDGASVSKIQRHVGGSFYDIKKIITELTTKEI